MRVQPRLNPFLSFPGVYTRIGVGICTVVFATVLTALLKPYVSDSLLFLPLAAVVFNSLFCGFTIGILTALAGSVGHGYFFMYPMQRWELPSARDLVLLIVFMCVAVFMSWIGALLRAANQRALVALRAREDLIEIVSHDLKNPLSTIQTTIQLLQRIAEKESATEIRNKGLLNIKTASEQMKRLIAGILDRERMESGKLELELREESVDQLLKAAKDNLTLLADQKGVRLEIKTTCADEKVLCDPERMGQVFSNLVGNAIKFSPPKCVVSIRCAIIDCEARFCVLDQGPGIRRDQLPNLFQRYWRGKDSALKGSGLGLWIAKSLVDAHEGRIWAESKSGQGSHFYFTLPLVKSGVRVKPCISTSAPRRSALG